MVFAAASCLAYVLLISSYCYAWMKMKTPVFSEESLSAAVSILIAARNEETSIDKCIQSVLQQTYPSQYIEIIIIDDASEDATNEKVRAYCKQYEYIKLITLNNNPEKKGKKYALAEGVRQAKGELIITTDADCVMENDWVKTIVAYYQQTHAKMIVAPVTFYNETTIFEKMQGLEFMSLIASSAASLYYNKAIMCNGANLAYTKNVFNEVNGFEGLVDKASGDDVLLMYKIKNKYPDSVKFLKHKDAMVYTKALSTLKDFVNQRKRWSSKGFKTLNKETQKVSLIVYLFNLIMLLLLLLQLLFSSEYFKTIDIAEFYFLLFVIKCVIDFLLLFLAASFFKKRINWGYFVLEECLYVFYVVFISLSGQLSKYDWKGRKTK